MTEMIAPSEKVRETLLSLRGWPLWLVFGTYVLAYLILDHFIGSGVLTERVYHNTFVDRLEHDRIEELFDVQRRLLPVRYAVTPLLLGLKIGFTALCLSVGAALLDYKAFTFPKMYNAALIAEGVFVFGQLLRTALAMFFLDIQSLDDFTSFSPLSLLSLVDPADMEKWMIYPLAALNVFEVLYVGVLGALLAESEGVRFRRMFKFSLFSYAPGLILLLLIGTFLILQFS